MLGEATRPLVKTPLRKVSLDGGSLQMKEVKEKWALVSNILVLYTNLLSSLVR